MSVQNPHDVLLKVALDSPGVAAGFFRDTLPEPLPAALDLDGLERLQGSFVDPELQETHADLLFRVPVRGGGEAFLYMLLEHQSSTDALMPFRLLRYTVRIWERWLRALEGPPRLPPVLPMILHHGPRPWGAPLQLSALYSLPPELLRPIANHLPDFHALLNDLTQQRDEELPQDPRARVTLLALKHAHDEGPGPNLLDWSEELYAAARAGDAQLISALLNYYLAAYPVAPDEPTLRALAQVVGPEPVEETMGRIISWREKARMEGLQEGKEVGLQEGREVGLQEGREVGLQEGREVGHAVGLAAGRRAMLLRIAEQRFGALPPPVRARIEGATVAQLDACVERLFQAQRPEDLFAG